MNRKESFIICTLLICVTMAGFYCSSDKKTGFEFKSGVVSTDWLDSNITMKNLLVVDVRSVGAFSNGHIENSINIPFIVPVSVWTEMSGDLLVQLPEESSLAASLGQKGISRASKVVLVGNMFSTDNPYPLIALTRVAITLAHMGLQDVVILDGGYDKWIKEGKNVTRRVTVPAACAFDTKVNNEMLVDVNYLKSKKDSVILIDARNQDVYSGFKIEPLAKKAGHIAGALSLPAPVLWNIDGTYKTRDRIEAIAREVAGEDKNREIIVYCSVGGFASNVWFALTRILDYTNVKIYDGSAQEWVKQNDMVTNAGI